MSTTIRHILGPARFRISRIVYHCDLADATSTAVPLGVMCDIAAGEVYGLTLVARRTLPDETLTSVGGLIRAPLSRPFDLLRKEFDLIWAARDDRAAAFAAVVKRHSASLRFSPLRMKQLQIPQILRCHPENIDDLRIWARDEMYAIRNHEFWSLLGEGSEPAQIPNLRRGSLIQTSPEKIAA